MSEVISDRLEQSMIVSSAGEGMVIQLANQLEIDKKSMLRMVAFGVIATICSISTPENREEHLQMALQALREKRAAGAVAAADLERLEE